MKKVTKRLFSLLLSVAFVFTALVSPVNAYAADSEAVPVVEEKNGYREFEGIEISAEELQELEEQIEEIEQGMVSEIYDSNDYSGYASWYCRNHMNAYQAAFYDRLYHMANAYLTTTANASFNYEYFVYLCEPISYSGLSYSEAVDILYCFLFQNPQFYFLSETYVYNTSEEIISVCLYEDFGSGYSRADMTNQFFGKIDNWIAQINGYTTDYSKLLKAQHIVCSNVEYVFNDYDQSAYSAVILGESVCAGYAKFYSLLANGVGFDCLGVTSYDHAWNVVNLDGAYYNVDTTWDDDEYSDIPYIDYFLTSDSYIIDGHYREDPYYDIAPTCYSNHNEYMERNIDSSGIFVATHDRNHVFAGMDVLTSYDENVEYRWIACNTLDNMWFEVQGWTKNNEWVDWYPEESGNYVLMCQARSCNDNSVYVEKSIGIEHHKYIKGKCQMPYTGEGGGYLIGFETFDNPGGQLRYEMLILDCTLLAEGKDAWTYTTGQCLVPETSFWTTWQPLYGYYWTLFRVYDADGNLLDEACYGFENI